MSSEYVRGLQSNSKIATDYYKKSLVKTEQQKLLEKILSENGDKFQAVADIACGGGTLSYHLSQLFPSAHFHLTDLNEDALAIAKDICTESKFHFTIDDITNITTLPKEHFDG